MIPAQSRNSGVAWHWPGNHWPGPFPIIPHSSLRITPPAGSLQASAAGLPPRQQADPGPDWWWLVVALAVMMMTCETFFSSLPIVPILWQWPAYLPFTFLPPFTHFIPVVYSLSWKNIRFIYPLSFIVFVGNTSPLSLLFYQCIHFPHTSNLLNKSYHLALHSAHSILPFPSHFFFIFPHFFSASVSSPPSPLSLTFLFLSSLTLTIYLTVPYSLFIIQDYSSIQDPGFQDGHSLIDGMIIVISSSSLVHTFGWWPLLFDCLLFAFTFTHTHISLTSHTFYLTFVCPLLFIPLLAPLLMSIQFPCLVQCYLSAVFLGKWLFCTPCAQWQPVPSSAAFLCPLPAFGLSHCPIHSHIAFVIPQWGRWRQS